MILGIQRVRRLTGSILCALFVMFGFVLANKLYAQSTEQNTFDEILHNAFSTTQLPGFSLALVKGGELEEVRAGGKINNEGNAPLTPNTPMQIGSVSKSFAALAIMQLVEAGEIDLDVSIESYLVEFADKPASAITLRQLLSHTSGYSTLQGNQTHTDFSADSEALARRVKDLSNIKPKLEPEQAFMYSNANFQIVGRIVEVVSGLAYHDYIQRKILSPLGMNDSYVLGGSEISPSAVGHRPWFGRHIPIEGSLIGTGSSPQGGVVTTASDLASYAMMMMNQQDDIISAQNKQMMMSAVSEKVQHYGLGWSIHPPLGLVWHNGSNPGFQAQLSMRPKTQDAFIFITNGGNSYGFNETSSLAFNLTLDALELEGPRGGGGLLSKIVFTSATILPFIFVYLAFSGWQKRANLSKHGAVRRLGITLLYVLIAVSLTWAMFVFVPSMFGIPLSVLALYTPDWGVISKALVYTSIGLAVVRIGLVIGVNKNQQ